MQCNKFLREKLLLIIVISENNHMIAKSLHNNPYRNKYFRIGGSFQTTHLPNNQVHRFRVQEYSNLEIGEKMETSHKKSY